jgi:hypothetical protein
MLLESRLAGSDMQTQSWIMAIIRLVLVFPVTYILLTFKRLYTWRFQVSTSIFTVFLGLLLGGFLVETLQQIASYGIGHDLYSELFRTPFNSESGWDTMLAIVAVASRLASSIGMIAMGWFIWKTNENLYGLAKPLSLLFSFLGVAISLTLTAVFSGWGEYWAYLFMTLATGSHAILYPLLSLLFYRATDRAILRPVQFS